MAEQPQGPGLARSLPLFTILGFEVRLNLSWLLLGLLITWTLAEGFFPERYPDLAAETRWWMGFAGAIGILFSIVFHELCHSVVGRHFGLPIGGITLFIFGGIAEMRQEPREPKTEFLMAGAGPLSSLLLAGACWIAAGLVERIGLPTPVVAVIGYLALINVVLAVFNLIPAYPLDGGRMLRAGLWAWRGNVVEATRTASRLGSGFGLALIFLGLLSFITGNFVAGVWWVLIGSFLRGAAAASFRQLLTRQFLNGRTVRELMNESPVSVTPALGLREFVDRYVYRHRCRLFPVTEGSRLVGCASIDRLKRIPDAEWNKKTVADITATCSSENTVEPDQDATELMAAMLNPAGASQKIVASGDRLLGTISLEELRNLMALRLELEDPER